MRIGKRDWEVVYICAGCDIKKMDNEEDRQRRTDEFARGFGLRRK